VGSPPLFPNRNPLAKGLGWPSPWGGGGGGVPVPLPGGAIRVGIGGAIVGLVDFLLDALLTFGAFVLASERSSLATCLAAVTSKPFELEP
jgi:hypothetical protein